MDPLTTRTLARVSVLLDEACEELEEMEPSARTPARVQQNARVISKVRDAQAILLGEKSATPEDN